MPVPSLSRVVSRVVPLLGLALVGALPSGCGTGGSGDDPWVWVEQGGRRLPYSALHDAYVAGPRVCEPAGPDGQLAYEGTFDVRAAAEVDELFAFLRVSAGTPDVSVTLRGDPLAQEQFVPAGPGVGSRNPMVVRVRTPMVAPCVILVAFATSLDRDPVYVHAQLRIVVEWSGPCDAVQGGEAVVFAGTPADLVAMGLSPGTVGGTDTEIWRLDDGVATPLTDNAVEDAFPAWSPMKERVAFCRLVAAPSPVFFRWVVMVMDADGGHPNIVGDFEGESALHPAFSPSGALLAMAVGDPGFGHTGIRVIDLSRAAGDPDRIVTLTDGSHEDLRPTWSPDSVWIAFQRDTAAILRVASNGSLAPTPLLDAPHLAPAAPDWGPRGLVLQGYDAAAFGYRVLWRDEAGALHWLTSGGGHVGDLRPRWSGDGLRVLFSRESAEADARLHFRWVDSPTEGAEVAGQPGGRNRDPDW